MVLDKTASEMWSPIFSSTENTLGHLYLGKNVKNRQFWDFLIKKTCFFNLEIRAEGGESADEI
jgi:hypothetical protein